MTLQAWASISYLEALRPPEGYRTDLALLASYSADPVVLTAALLALAGLDDDRGSGSKIDFANAVTRLKGRVRLVVQAGRVISHAKVPRIAGILDQFIREVNHNEAQGSWHPKIALAKQVSDDGEKALWSLWLGSRNLTRDLSWDVGLALAGRAGDSGSLIADIPALGRSLAERADLDQKTAAAVEAELERVRWSAPEGCIAKSVRLRLPGAARGLPAAPNDLKKLIVISPFIDSETISELGAWGDTASQRLLVSTLPELGKLSMQSKRPLDSFDQLLYLGAPDLNDYTGREPGQTEMDSSLDEEPEPQGLHAKVIYAETKRARRLWIGSTNATTRGWNGRNCEVVAELEISGSVADGLEHFVRNHAQTAGPEQLTDSTEETEAEAVLEQVRKALVAAWGVTQRMEGQTPLLISTPGSLPDRGAVELRVGLLGHDQIMWPDGATEVCLPKVRAGEETELVVCSLSLGAEISSWLMRAPLDPPPDEARDRSAFARYLSPKEFLCWVKSMLASSAENAGVEDWDVEHPPTPTHRARGLAPAWWAPTLEEALKAWIHDPRVIAEVDRNVQHFLKLYPQSEQSDHSAEELALVREFHATWQVLRRELISKEP